MSTRPYAYKLNEIIARLLANTDQNLSLLQPRKETNRVLFIVVGSDRGLCGGFNNNLFKVVEQEISENYDDHFRNGTLDLICIGDKPTRHFKNRDYNIVEEYIGLFDDLNFERSSKIMKNVVNQYDDGTYDKVFLCFNEFKSVITQKRIVDQVLPIAEKFEQDDEAPDIDYLFEPEPYEILETLLPRYLNMQLWRALLESFGSEQGARMAAMDNATENANEIIKDLNLKYNRARQASITTEISEIVSGAEALAE